MELERCGFFHLEVNFVFNNSVLFIFFYSKTLGSIRGLFPIFFLEIYEKKNFQYFLKRIRCSKYKQQGIVKVLMIYQMQNLQCSILKIATCEAFLINTKILS